MDYRIEVKKGFTVIGKRIRVSTAYNQNQNMIPKFWSESNKNGLTEKILALTGSMEERQTGLGNILGICADFGVPNEFDYWIGIETSSETASPELERMEIPAATWAVFESTGSMPNAIKDVWKRIFTEFFSESEYKHTDLPDIELYPKGDVNSPDYSCEIWVPVV